jgi:hypothetical protein
MSCNLSIQLSEQWRYPSLRQVDSSLDSKITCDLKFLELNIKLLSNNPAGAGVIAGRDRFAVTRSRPANDAGSARRVWAAL